MKCLKHFHLSFDEGARPLITDEEAVQLLSRHLEGDCGDLTDPEEVLECLSLFLQGDVTISSWDVRGNRLVFASDNKTGNTLIATLDVWNDAVRQHRAHE